MKLLLTLLLASLLPAAQAGRRVAEAQVRTDANGQPCFTISEREEKRSGTPDFEAIAVTEGQRLLWRMAMSGKRTFPLSATMCIPYGGRVPALPQTPATSLEEGKTYTMELKALPGRSATTPLRYAARFRLGRRPDGSTTVHQLGEDERSGYDLPGRQPR
jgi:hypothetical protein